MFVVGFGVFGVFGVCVLVCVMMLIVLCEMYVFGVLNVGWLNVCCDVVFDVVCLGVDATMTSEVMEIDEFDVDVWLVNF